jgi:hypothetical protein
VTRDGEQVITNASMCPLHGSIDCLVCLDLKFVPDPRTPCILSYLSPRGYSRVDSSFFLSSRASVALI